MKKVLIFSVLLILGLICSQLIGFVDSSVRGPLEFLIKNLTLIFLSFIMIHVGLEFTIEQFKIEKLWLGLFCGLYRRLFSLDFLLTLFFFQNMIRTSPENLISAAFMFIVGASMPFLSKDVLSAQNLPGILFDVLVLTILSKLGKMFPLFCYQKEATIRQRLALAIAMSQR